MIAPGIPAKYKPKSKVPNEYYDPDPFINRMVNEMVHLQHIREGKVPKEKSILEELGFGEFNWN